MEGRKPRRHPAAWGLWPSAELSGETAQFVLVWEEARDSAAASDSIRLPPGGEGGSRVSPFAPPPPNDRTAGVWLQSLYQTSGGGTVSPPTAAPQMAPRCPQRGPRMVAKEWLGRQRTPPRLGGRGLYFLTRAAWRQPSAGTPATAIKTSSSLWYHSRLSSPGGLAPVTPGAATAPRTPSSPQNTQHSALSSPLWNFPKKVRTD